MSDKKEKNALSQRKRRNNQILQLLAYCRLLAGNYHYIILLRPAQKKSSVTYENYFVEKIYRPCDDVYELIYDDREHRCIKKHDETLKYYLVQHVILKEMQSCGFKFRWRDNPREYTYDGITFTRKVPWYMSHGSVQFDNDKLRLGLGWQTHHIFANSESRILFCLINQQDNEKIRISRSPSLDELTSIFVVPEEDLSSLAIDNN